MNHSASSTSRQGIGLPIAGFSLPLARNQELAANVTLEEVLAGRKGALVVFWSGICAHCVRYDEYFNSFAATHPDVGFAAIASRLNETQAQMRQAIEERHLGFPVLLDADGAVARQFYAQQTPRCYLISAERTLIYRGAIDNFKMPGDPEYLEYLEPAIRSFLAGEPVARPETASFGCAIANVYYQLPKQL